MQRRLLQSFTYILEWGRGTCTLTKHTRRWTYPALRHFSRCNQYFSNVLTDYPFRIDKSKSVLPHSAPS